MKFVQSALDILKCGFIGTLADPRIGGTGDDPSYFPPPLLSFPCQEAAPLNPAMGPGERCKLPVWTRADPGHRTLFCAFIIKNRFRL